MASPAMAQYSRLGAPTEIDCESTPCADALPGATSFAPLEGTPFMVGVDAEGEVRGWVGLSTQVVDIVAYSGKPLATLVGLDPDGNIAGVRLIHHSEPILLTGIPESVLHEFCALYPGYPATQHIVVGTSRDANAVSVDVISGATVTTLAQNRTILETALAIGSAVGVVDLAVARPGHFVEEEAPWSWAQMQAEGVFGHLVVTNRDMGRDRDGEFVDLTYAIADAPQIGRALLGDELYEHALEEIGEGQHLFVILGNGSSSFKGSAFVRGGIFDRVRVDQGFVEIVFRDTDYRNLSSPRLEGAPRFREGAVFVTNGGFLDPGQPFDLIFLGSRYDGRGGFTRDFREFRSTLQLPSSLYVYDGPDPNEPMWVQAWRNRTVHATFLAIYLMFVIFVFAARRWSTADAKRLRRLHVFSMTIGLFGIGMMMRSQPSVTQMLTLIESLIHEWRWELFLSEPLIMLFWVFIFVVSLIWGRGLFCGWICPYGALTELLFDIRKFLRIPDYELPDWIHLKLRYLRYFILLALIPIFLFDSILGEQLAEVEPFKSTFLVPFWTRHWGFGVYWVALAVWSVFTFRPFCRYICPLGAGLAVFNSFRFSGPRRRSFCTNCKICTKGCEPKAIRPDGTIDARECLSCMECEANYRAEEVCPPLIAVSRLTAKSKADGLPIDPEKLKKLQKDIADV